MEENDVIEGEDNNPGDTESSNGAEDALPDQPSPDAEDTKSAVDTDDFSWEDAGLGTESTQGPEGIDDVSWEDGELDTSDKKSPSPLPKFTDLKKDPSKMRSGNLGFILDISLEVTVELGRTRMVINDLLQLGQGSIVELAKLAGESLEVLVNGKLIARGEVVVVNDKFGVRLTEVVPPEERIEQLG